MDKFTVTVEYTDTFGGEANYSWVKRTTLSLPYNASRRSVMYHAKKAMGLTGVRGDTTDTGDTIGFRPYNSCTVLYVTFF